MMRVVVAAAVLAVALTGCAGHAGHPTVTKIDDTAVKSPPATISPYQLLREPSSQNGISDVPLAGGPGRGDTTFPLTLLPLNATHLIVRWTCDGKGILKVIIDGVVWAESPCATNVVSSGDLPLWKVKDRHPKMVTIDVPSDVYWKVAVVERGGAIS